MARSHNIAVIMRHIAIIASLLFLCRTFATCQVTQGRPELCGRLAGVITLPNGFSAAVDRQSGVTDVTVATGRAPIRLSNISEIFQVCPLQNDRMVIFADPGFGFSVIVIDTAKGVMLDRFLAYYTPSMSPDQRWLVFPKFYPRFTELPASDEYLIYNLSKSPEANRPSGAKQAGELDVDVGSVIFPVGWKNESGDNIGRPEEQQHGMGPVFWAPDGRSLVFDDGVMNTHSVVWVTITENGVTSARVHPFPSAEECPNFGLNGELQEGPPTALSDVEFGPGEGVGALLLLKFRSDLGELGCASKPIALYAADFQPAKVEIRVPEKGRRKAKKSDRS